MRVLKLTIVLLLLSETVAAQSTEARRAQCLRDAEIVSFDQSRENALDAVERRQAECHRQYPMGGYWSPRSASQQRLDDLERRVHQLEQEKE